MHAWQGAAQGTRDKQGTAKEERDATEKRRNASLIHRTVGTRKEGRGKDRPQSRLLAMKWSK
eukprot:9017284-Pyramimonas_sp.AAC.1